MSHERPRRLAGQYTLSSHTPFSRGTGPTVPFPHLPGRGFEDYSIAHPSSCRCQHALYPHALSHSWFLSSYHFPSPSSCCGVPRAHHAALLDLLLIFKINYHTSPVRSRLWLRPCLLLSRYLDGCSALVNNKKPVTRLQGSLPDAAMPSAGPDFRPCESARDTLNNDYLNSYAYKPTTACNNDQCIGPGLRPRDAGDLTIRAASTLS